MQETYLRREGRHLVTNLRLGLGLLRLRRYDTDTLLATAGRDQILLLILLGMGLQFVLGWLYYQPDARFNYYGVAPHAIALGLVLLVAHLASRRLQRPEAARGFLLGHYAAGTWLLVLAYLLGLLMEHFETLSPALQWTLYLGILAWATLVAWHILRLFHPGLPHRLAQAFTLYLLLFLLPSQFYSRPAFWYPAPPRAEARVDRYAAYRRLDTEDLLYQQPERLEAAFAGLRPQRPGKTDLYFVGFAGYARQDVFLKEVNFTRALFDRRFDTRDRSLNLINNLKTLDKTPLATATNLRLTLSHLGKLIDPAQDMVVIFLTSHGTRRHNLSVDFWPMHLNQISPQRLKQDLDAAGIKWRILIVSACYSGGFVEPLKTPYTFIATAAAPNRTSFGCSNENDFTYFGEAFIRDELSRDYSLVNAFRLAAQHIAARERQEKLSPSQPQLFVGAAMQAKLQRLSERLATSHASDTLSARACHETPVTGAADRATCQPGAAQQDK